jgi:hypothetical protein
LNSWYLYFSSAPVLEVLLNLLFYLCPPTYLFIYLGGTGVWTQGLVLARQALLPLLLNLLVLSVLDSTLLWGLSGGCILNRETPIKSTKNVKNLTQKGNLFIMWELKQEGKMFLYLTSTGKVTQIFTSLHLYMAVKHHECSFSG